MPADEELAQPPKGRGRLTIIGTGITALAQMSPQAVSYIEQADISLLPCDERGDRGPDTPDEPGIRGSVRIL